MLHFVTCEIQELIQTSTLKYQYYVSNNKIAHKTIALFLTMAITLLLCVIYRY